MFGTDAGRAWCLSKGWLNSDTASTSSQVDIDDLGCPQEWFAGPTLWVKRARTIGELCLDELLLSSCDVVRASVTLAMSPAACMHPTTPTYETLYSDKHSVLTLCCHSM